MNELKGASMASMFHITKMGKRKLKVHLEIITVKKRNWYLIGVDIDTIPIRNIRNIFINEHLFGSDLHIKIFGATISALCLSKKDSIKIRSILLNL